MRKSLIASVFVVHSLQVLYSSVINDKCRTYSEDLMDCSLLNLTEVPSLMNIPNNIKFLNLSWNTLTGLSPFSIPRDNSLTGLSLSHNHITSIEKGTFGNLSSLHGLDLSYNRLHGSSLKDKFNMDVPTFHQLKRFSLRGNPLNIIKRLTFTSTEYLRLEYLDLSMCSIKNLENSAIVGLPVLKTLNLSHNNMEMFNPSSVESTLELSVLDLSYNKIESIQEFSLSINLQKIYLQNNRISTIKDNAFSSVVNLQYLSLAHNNLRVLSPLSVPWNTAQMALQGNPWRCDCNIRWLREPNKEVNPEVINITIICAYPSRLRGKDIKQLTARDLNCPTSYAGPVIAVLMSTFLILMSLVAAIALYRKRKSLSCRKSRDQGGDYRAVFTHDEVDETQSKVTFSDELRLVGEKEIYA